MRLSGWVFATAHAFELPVATGSGMGGVFPVGFLSGKCFLAFFRDENRQFFFAARATVLDSYIPRPS